MGSSGSSTRSPKWQLSPSCHSRGSLSHRPASPMTRQVTEAMEEQVPTLIYAPVAWQHRWEGQFGNISSFKSTCPFLPAAPGICVLHACPTWPPTPLQATPVASDVRGRQKSTINSTHCHGVGCTDTSPSFVLDPWDSSYLPGDGRRTGQHTQSTQKRKTLHGYL